MRLNITLNKNYLYMEDFLKKWLIPSISKYLKSQIYKNKQLLINYNKDKNLLYRDLIEASNNIIYYHKYDKNDILIQIDPNKKNPENDAKLYDICAMVNYGSRDCPALPIFTKTFNYFAENFWVFFSNYEVGILPCP